MGSLLSFIHRFILITTDVNLNVLLGLLPSKSKQFAYISPKRPPRMIAMRKEAKCYNERGLEAFLFICASLSSAKKKV